MRLSKDLSPVSIAFLNIAILSIVHWKSVVSAESAQEALALFESEKEKNFSGILYALTPLWPLLVNLLIIQYLFFPLTYYGDYTEESQIRLSVLLENRRQLAREIASEHIAQQMTKIEEELDMMQASNKLLCRTEIRSYIDRAGVFDLYYSLAMFSIRAVPLLTSDPLFQQTVENSIVFSALLHAFFVLKEFFNQGKACIHWIQSFIFAVHFDSRLLESNVE